MTETQTQPEQGAGAEEPAGEPTQTATIVLKEYPETIRFEMKLEHPESGRDDGSVPWEEASQVLQIANLMHRIGTVASRIGTDSTRELLGRMEMLVGMVSELADEENQENGDGE